MKSDHCCYDVDDEEHLLGPLETDTPVGLLFYSDKKIFSSSVTIELNHTTTVNMGVAKLTEING